MKLTFKISKTQEYEISIIKNEFEFLHFIFYVILKSPTLEGPEFDIVSGANHTFLKMAITQSSKKICYGGELDT